MKTRPGLLALVMVLPSFLAQAQYNIREERISFPMIGATAAFQMPGGDMADRFGNNFNIGAVFQWKLKNNWLWGIEGDFLFSDNVKEKIILDRFMTEDGNIIDGQGQYGTVVLAERGLKLEAKAGKIFPFIGPNPNSGFMTTLGIGYMQHKIYIDTPGSPIPYLEGDYRKGYDRLSTGLSLTEFIGYMNFSNSKLINFYIGIEITQAFTHNIREINFDTGLRDDASRFDQLYGIRLGWVFPIYKRMAEKIYYN